MHISFEIRPVSRREEEKIATKTLVCGTRIHFLHAHQRRELLRDRRDRLVSRVRPPELSLPIEIVSIAGFAIIVPRATYSACNPSSNSTNSDTYNPSWNHHHSHDPCVSSDPDTMLSHQE